MWFDVQSALKKIERDCPCDTRDTATNSAQIDQKPAVCRDVANVATLAPLQKKTDPPKKTGSQKVLDAIDKGNAAGSRWQPRHGSIASETGLGGTVTYKLVDRMIANGRITQGRDGVLKTTDENPKSNRKYGANTVETGVLDQSKRGQNE